MWAFDPRRDVENWGFLGDCQQRQKDYAVEIASTVVVGTVVGTVGTVVVGTVAGRHFLRTLIAGSHGRRSLRRKGRGGRKGSDASWSAGRKAGESSLKGEEIDDIQERKRRREEDLWD